MGSESSFTVIDRRYLTINGDDLSAVETTGAEIQESNLRRGGLWK